MQEITGKRNKVAFCEKFPNNYFIIIIIRESFGIFQFLMNPCQWLVETVLCSLVDPFL